MNYISVPRALCATGPNGYSDEGQAAKEAFHREGVEVSERLWPRPWVESRHRTTRSNKAGTCIVSGEVTLHSDDLYLQLGKLYGPGVKAL